MKYIYFYSVENIDRDNNYMFGRYSYTTDKYAPVKCAYSDDLTDWNDQSPDRALVTPPKAWPTGNIAMSIKEFLQLPTTYTAHSPKAFKMQYPELFI